MWQTIVAACGGAVIAVIGQLVMWVVNRRASKRDNFSETIRNISMGVECELRNTLKHLAKKYIERGHVDADDLQELMDMHQSYKALGGNGYLDTLIDAVKRLPISEE